MPMQERKLPELLSPAGSPQALEAAISGGADAVYLGGRLLNARMRAKNFDDEAMKAAVYSCHEKGVRLYVTLNTLVYDRECDEAVRYAHFLYESGVDALIMADMGMSRKIREYLPDFELHASTQMSGHNIAAAEFLASQGFSRMVAARELSEENLRMLTSASPIETEIFVHGALCVSQSGQCLCSWALGGRSGNRGECAQPCRMKYNGKYPLSLRDNCLAGHITSLIGMGASSLKLEGRLKPPEYVYAVTRTYRTLLDEGRNADDEELRYLAEVFSRDGFTDGYFTGNIGMHMLGVRMEGESRIPPRRQKPPVRNTEAVSVKRSADALPEERIKFDRFRSPKILKNTARFYDPASVPKSAEKFFSRIYLPLEKYEKLNMVCDGIVLPPVIPDSELVRVKRLLGEAREKGANAALVGNYGHIELARSFGFELHGDYRFNIANCGSAEFFGGIFADYILSPELNMAQIRDITGAKAVIVYGRIPLMTLEKPVGCGSLKGEKGEKFPIIRDGGRDVLLNALPLYMADRDKELSGAFAGNRHFIFTTESAGEAENIINAYKNRTPAKDGANIRRIK